MTWYLVLLAVGVQQTSAILANGGHVEYPNPRTLPIPGTEGSISARRLNGGGRPFVRWRPVRTIFNGSPTQGSGSTVRRIFNGSNFEVRYRSRCTLRVFCFSVFSAPTPKVQGLAVFEPCRPPRIPRRISSAIRLMDTRSDVSASCVTLFRPSYARLATLLRP